jgi:hypothetical protein
LSATPGGVPVSTTSPTSRSRPASVAAAASSWLGRYIRSDAALSWRAAPLTRVTSLSSGGRSSIRSGIQHRGVTGRNPAKLFATLQYGIAST